jgi:hypothetical protein
VVLLDFPDAANAAQDTGAASAPPHRSR